MTPTGGVARIILERPPDRPWHAGVLDLRQPYMGEIPNSGEPFARSC